MRRPRIALWIRRRTQLVQIRWGWWCPRWVRLWAVRRVDRWNEGDKTVRWTPVRLPSKSFVVDQRLADIMGLKEKLPGESWDQAKKHYRPNKIPKRAPPMPPSEKRGPQLPPNGPRESPMPPRTR